MRKYLHFPVLMLIIIWCGFTFASDTSSSNINYQGHETQLLAPLQGMDPTSPEYDMLKTQILKQFEQEERARISAEIEQMKNNYYAAQKEEEIRVKNEYVSRLRAEKAIEKAEWVNQQPSNVVTANANGSLPIETQKEESNIQYDASLYPTPRQGGDTFADASVIGALPFSDAGTTCGYVDDYDAVCPYTGSTSPDVVYEFTTAGGTYDISLCGASDYDTKLYVLDASLTEYACNDDSCPGYVSELIDVTLAAGTYYIIVDGYGGDCGNYTIDVIDTTPVECLDNSLTLYMYDSYGDGWNGNVFNIFDASGNLVDSATLESGDYGTAEFCLPGGDYTVDVDGGSWQSEVSWELYDSAGNLILSGGCPFAGSFTLGGGGGCTDNALTLNMYDSYGDGWNGNYFDIFDSSGNLVDSVTLDSGSEGTAELCLPDGDYTVSVDGGSWQSEVSWELYDSAGNLILSGGCPFAGSFTLGGGGECMDTIVDLFIDFDSWPDEVTWDLTDDLGNVLYAGGPGSGDTYSESYCLADGNYIFNIYDAWGDGIYCTGGYYELSTGGNIIAGGPGVGCDYGEGESTPFTIPFGGTGECTDLVLYMYDSYGDGWNGNYFVATDADGNVLVEETLSTGSYGEVYFCLDDGAYWVTVDDGSWQSEVSWEVFDLAGNLILGGGCPFGGFLLVNVPEPVLGCTDPDAMNYNPDATWDDGSCNYDCLDIPFTIWIFTASWGSEISWDLTDSGGNIVAFGSDYSSNSSYSYDLCLPEGWYVFNMYDSYGDGWNGGYAEFWDENGFVFFSETLDSGSFAAWDIYIGIQVPGCTDPEAWNYNPDATVDDGSCEYLDGPWGLTAVPDLTGTQLDWHDPAEVPPIVQYHDDVLANAFYFYSNYEGGYAHGTRFDVDGVYDIQAVSVKILSEGDAYWPWPNETHGPVRLMVFDDNGGVPGNMIWDEYTTAVDGWATVYPGYTGMFGSFYVIASHADDWSLTGDPEGFGIDGSVDFPDNMYTLYEGLWYTDDYLGYGGDYMFTAWVGGDYGLEAISYHNEIPPAILGQDVEDNSSAVHDGSIVNTDGTESFPSYITNDLERDLIGFEIYRDGVVVGNVDAMTYSFLDEFAYDEFVDYCYVVRGVYDEGLSLPSNEACVVFLGADPDAPTNVTAEAWWDDTDVTSGITWAWDWSVPVDCQNFDCVGTCADDYLDWLADGLCDDGTWGIDFNCAEWNFDEGDCDGGGNMNVTINIFTDNYPGETWWELYDSAGNFVDGITAGDLINSATLYTWDLVLTPGTYNFTIYDYWGDGICCSYGEGYYELWVDGALIGTGGDFGAEAVHSFTIGGLLLSSSEAVYSSPIIGEKGQSDIDISGIELIRTMTYQNEVKPYVPQTRALFDLADGTHQAVNVNRDVFFTLYFDYQGDSYAFTTSDYFIDIIGFDYDIEVCGVVTATNEWNQESIPSDPPACATTVPPPTCDYVAPENFTVSDTGSSLYLEWTHPDYVDPSMVLGETMANPFIVDAVPYFDSGSTIGHLDDYDEVCPYSGSTSADVVYYWDAVPGDWTFDICESDYDTKIYVYDGNGILLGCTDDSCSNSSGNPYRSDLGLTILDYGPLYIIIDGYNGNSGNYNFEIYEGLPVLSDNDPQPVKDDDMSDMNVDRECGITHFNVYLETEEGACPPGQFMDCEGFCVDDFYLSWIGDGWCDDGTYGVYLYCEEFNWDDGDCDGEPNQSYKAPADNVQPASRNWTLIATTIYPNFEFFDVIPNQEFCFMVTADDMYLGYNESPPAGPLCNSVFVEVPNPPFDVMAEGTWYEPDNSSAIEWSWSHDQVVDCQNFDCVGTCADDYLDWLADGMCDDGTWGIDFNCAEWNFDEGDCGGGGDCPTGEILDCNGNCAPEGWLGDGDCDDGQWTWNGVGIVFNCEELNWDNGDCGGGGDCPDGEVLDCMGICNPESWIGDGLCDDGQWGAYFNCAEFNYDNGDCAGDNQGNMDEIDHQSKRYVAYKEAMNPLQPAVFNLADGTHQTQNIDRDVFFTLYFTYDGDDYVFDTSDLNILIYGFNIGDEVCGVVTATNEFGMESDPSDPPACGISGDPGMDCLYDPPQNVTATPMDDTWVLVEWEYAGYEPPTVGDCADFGIPGLPFNDVNSNVGMSDDFDVSGSDGADVAYELTLNMATTITVDLCSALTDYDAKLEIFTADGDCVPTSTGYYDDDGPSCPESPAQYAPSLIENAYLEAGTYFVVVDGYSGGEGNYEINIWESGGGGDECVPAPYDDDCYMYVISIDPYCCETEWDSLCEGEYQDCIAGDENGGASVEEHTLLNVDEAMAYEAQKSGMEITEIQWNIPTPESIDRECGVTHFNIYMDGVMIGSTDQLFFEYYGGAEGCFDVTASDMYPNDYYESDPGSACASLCGDAGDWNEDGAINVLDIVQIVGYILNGGDITDCQFHAGDWNMDGAINVLDIVQIVGCILSGCNPRADEATSVNFIKTDGEMKFNADGYVGGVQMTLTHNSDFSIQLTTDAYIAEYVTNGNITKLIVINPESGVLFTATGAFEVTEVLAATSESLIETNISTPDAFTLSAAYPNPFNPTTSFTLEIPQDGFVSVQVYNVVGQVVDVLLNKNMTAGYYNISWTASNVPSGMYIVRSTMGKEVQTQKIMLLK